MGEALRLYLSVRRLEYFGGAKSVGCGIPLICFLEVKVSYDKKT